jgi:hypothetical protein
MRRDPFDLVSVTFGRPAAVQRYKALDELTMELFKNSFSEASALKNEKEKETLKGWSTMLITAQSSWKKPVPP